jgi:hypothetical protein
MPELASFRHGLDLGRGLPISREGRGELGIAGADDFPACGVGEVLKAAVRDYRD